MNLNPYSFWKNRIKNTSLVAEAMCKKGKEGRHNHKSFEIIPLESIFPFPSKSKIIVEKKREFNTIWGNGGDIVSGEYTARFTDKQFTCQFSNDFLSGWKCIDRF